MALKLPVNWQKYLKDLKAIFPSTYSRVQIQVAALEYFSNLSFSVQLRLIMVFLEHLEDRDLLSAIASLNNGILTVQSDNNDNTIVVSTLNNSIDNNTVRITQSNKFNDLAGLGSPLDFTGVTSINFVAGSGDNYFANNTAIPSTQDGSKSDSLVLVGGTNNDNLIGSNSSHSDTFIQDPSGTNLIVGGQGSNNLFGGNQTDTIIVGPRFNAVYDILGKNFIVATLPKSSGYLIVNAISNTIVGNNNLATITFFQSVVVNSPTPFIYQRDSNGNGIVYLNPLTQNVSFIINQFGKTIVINYIDSNGSQTFAIDRQQVQWIASFGTAGNDIFINNTYINNVFYGSGGNDILIGGFGINVLKGHSGNDYLLARGIYNDLQAGLGNSILVGGFGFNIFRNNSTNTTIDQNVGRYDIIVGVPQIISYRKLSKHFFLDDAENRLVIGL